MNQMGGLACLCIVAVSPLLRAAMVVNGEHVASSDQNQVTAAHYTAGIVSDDLIDSSNSSFVSVEKDKEPFFETTTLNDGLGCPATGGAKGTFMPVTLGSGGKLPFTYTFVLDTSICALGYDISEIRSYAGWLQNGQTLANQRYELLVSTVDTPTFVSLGVFEYLPFNSSDKGQSSASKMVLSESGGGAISSGVTALRFVFMDHGQEANLDGTVYYEVDVIGQPTAGNVPQSANVLRYVYDGIGQGASPTNSGSTVWPDTGGVELINGILPAVAHYTDPEWVGFLDGVPDDRTSHPQVTFELDRQYDLTGISIVYFHSTEQAGGTVTAPEEVRVSFSTNGASWTAPATFSSEFNHASGDEIRVAKLDVSVSPALFVRLDFRNSSPWTFLGQVSFETEGGNPQHFALQHVITEAQVLHDAAVEGTSDGDYPVGAKATLLAAISAAQGVDDDPDATFSVLRAAEQTLNEARDAFRLSVVGGLPMLNHILGTGQSLSVGWNGGPPLTTTQPYSNLMLSGVGQTGSELVPLIEGPNLNNDQVETISSALANTLTALSPSLRYTSIVTRHGQGGEPYASLKKGTSWYAKGMGQVAKAQAAAQGIDKSYRVVAVTTVHGESDHQQGLGAHYAGYLKQWQADYDADVKAMTGQSNDVLMFLCQMSSHTRYQTATSVVPAQQLWAAENSRYHYLVCPKYFLTYSDGVHLTAQSYRHLGEYYGKALKRVLVDHAEWQPLKPVRIMRQGRVITVDFFVPVPPLSIDTTAVLAQTNYGFEYADDGASASISSVAIGVGDTIVITLNADPVGANPRLRYAYTGVPGSWSGCNQSGAPRGNIRDNDDTSSLYGNNLHNWLVHFDHPIPFDPAVDDFDGDGVADRWEYLNFGDTNLTHGVNSNADGDSMDDLSEWIAGTDPNDASDVFRIEAQSVPADNAVELSWNTITQRDYSLLYAASLSNGTAWASIFTATGTSRRIAFTNDCSAVERRFFKVQVTPQ